MFATTSDLFPRRPATEARPKNNPKKLPNKLHYTTNYTSNIDVPAGPTIIQEFVVASLRDLPSELLHAQCLVLRRDAPFLGIVNTAPLRLLRDVCEEREITFFQDETSSPDHV